MQLIYMNFYGNLHSTKLRNMIRKIKSHFKVSKRNKRFSFMMTINGEVKCRNSLSTTQNALPFFYCGNLTLFGWFDTKLGLFAAEQSHGTTNLLEQTMHWDMLNNKNSNLGLCLTCPSASFALQYGGFVPCDCSAAKGPFSC